jgi:hypothetical protein
VIAEHGTQRREQCDCESDSVSLRVVHTGNCSRLRCCVNVTCVTVCRQTASQYV